VRICRRRWRTELWVAGRELPDTPLDFAKLSGTSAPMARTASAHSRQESKLGTRSKPLRSQRLGAMAAWPTILALDKAEAFGLTGGRDGLAEGGHEVALLVLPVPKIPAVDAHDGRRMYAAL
jgi:hypothetical protein